MIAVEDPMTSGPEPQMRPRAGTWSMPSRTRRQKSLSTSSQPDSNSSSGRATPTPSTGKTNNFYLTKLKNKCLGQSFK